MFYLPKDWLRQPQNAEAVQKVLTKYLGTDIREQGGDSDKLIDELKALGEDIVVEKLKNGAFCQ